mmetsp:Transcript_24785/g.97963  ORF Transcript_24785/g.97963 Transcript_24785/m.97963 type:complete len:117 (+) Transcript_24785:177-527(+)
MRCTNLRSSLGEEKLILRFLVQREELRTAWHHILLQRKLVFRLNPFFAYAWIALVVTRKARFIRYARETFSCLQAQYSPTSIYKHFGTSHKGALIAGQVVHKRNHFFDLSGTFDQL